MTMKIMLAALAALPALAGTVNFDFETGDLQEWKVVSGTFGQVVSDRATEHHGGGAYTKQGKWFLSTLETKDGEPADGFTGVIESPVVRLEDGTITLKVGGGKGPDVYFAVCTLDGREVAYARGEDSQKMLERTISVPQLAGKPVFFRVSDQAMGGWGHITVDAVTCRGTIDAAATRARAQDAWTRSLKAAIEELGRRFPEYPAKAFLERLAGGAEPGALAREALVQANPLVNRAEILFTTHEQYASDHHNTATLFQPGEINAGKYTTQGAMKALDVKTGKVRIIVPEEPARTVRDPELDSDGRRIVFSMRKGPAEDYKIWAVNTDGSDLRQITFAAGVADIDPIWLPDGDILFSSTREPKYCMCNRHRMCNLYRMKPNGANIHQIGKSTLFEGHACLLPDGRVLYDRWEYVDRDFGDAQGLWVCYPDGTGHAIYWGNNTTSPGGVINARPLSKGTQVIAVLGSCHDRPWGALGIIDRSLGVDGPVPVLQTWPEAYRKRIHAEGEDFDSSKSVRLRYADPFPLDDSHFLACRMTGQGEETGLVYLDRLGNEVMFYREAPGCWSPMPIRPTRKPPVQPTRRDFSDPHGRGLFYLQNVYIGTHMAGVEKGSIKALRIVESPEKRQWTGPVGWNGHGEEAACMNWHSFENKRILGTVPVEADGSAYFEVPGNTYVYFQALDAKGRMVQSMRSGAYVQPGETYGCIGCHENRVGDIPSGNARPVAMTRAPSKLNGWYGPARLFSFQKEVQPVFDRHCVSCHDYGKRAGAKLNLSGDRDVFFSTSYVDLWALGAIHCIGGGPALIQPAKSWGSLVSKLTRKLYGHGRAKLTAEERDRVITWMDINAVYYPTYECAYPANPGGRSPLAFDELKRLTELTGVKIANSHGARQRSQLDFARPELSRILDGLRDKPDCRAAYDEALALIRSGAERLKATPRADMDGFKPCALDQVRETKYQASQAAEARVYEAIRTGKEVFDPRPKTTKN